MHNVIEMFPSSNIPESLRAIADNIESGELVYENMTLIGGSDVFQLGGISDQDAVAAGNAIFNMTAGIHKLMIPIFSCED